MAEPGREPWPEAPVVPLESAGLRIACDRDSARIVASGSTSDEARDAAVALSRRPEAVPTTPTGRGLARPIHHPSGRSERP